MGCCCCGHGQWGHHFGMRRPQHMHSREYEYGMGYARGPRRRRSRQDELQEYVHDLEEELADVKAELDELRGHSSP